MVGVEARVHALQPGEALHQEPGSREQRQRQRHLGDDQHPSQALPTPVAGAGAAAFLEHAVEVRARGVKRRREAEEESGEHRNHEREGHDRPVDPDFICAGQIPGIQGRH
jgi:hypothetical protein